jgi:hypothetical protein
MARLARSVLIALPERPKRPEVKKEFKLQGGWIFNPPDNCKKKKLDADKQYSVETTVCAYYCNEKIHCKCHDWLMQGGKERKKYRTEGEV